MCVFFNFFRIENHGSTKLALIFFLSRAKPARSLVIITNIIIIVVVIVIIISSSSIIIIYVTSIIIILLLLLLILLLLLFFGVLFTGDQQSKYTGNWY